MHVLKSYCLGFVKMISSFGTALHILTELVMVMPHEPECHAHKNDCYFQGGGHNECSCKWYNQNVIVSAISFGLLILLHHKLGVSYKSIRCSRSNSQWRFKISVNVCRNNVFRTTEQSEYDSAIYNPNMTSPWWQSTSALMHQWLVCLMGESCHHSAWVWTTWLCLWQASICCAGQTLWQTFVDRWTVDSLSCDRSTVDNLSHDRWTVNNLSCNRWMNWGQLVLWQMNCGQLVLWQMNCGQLVLWQMNCGQIVLWQVNCGQLVLWQMNWTIWQWADALYCFIYFFLIIFFLTLTWSLFLSLLLEMSSGHH